MEEENKPSEYSIYRIKGPEGKSYIGQTIDIETRFNTHMRNRSGLYLLSKAIRKFGADKFEFEVIKTGLTKAEADIQEEFNITRYNTLYPNGYNNQRGGRNKCSAFNTIIIDSVEYKSINQAASELGLAATTIAKRIKSNSYPEYYKKHTNAE